MATLVLVAIAMSLSYIVYEGVSKISPPQQDVFANQVSPVGGPLGLVKLSINSSSTGMLLTFEAGDASSQSGVLYFDGAGYGTTQRLCLPDATTFFSVHTTAGVLNVSGDGKSWIDGYWTTSLDVDDGWQEVMFSDSSSCGITLNDGVSVTYPGDDFSTLPLMGTLPSSSYIMYVPTAGPAGPFLLVFEGGYDSIA
jgi:hypothetical protein